MGVRFYCPNGHRLNVKSYLVGERGICPHCDARFIVPSESGGVVQEIVPEELELAPSTSKSMSTSAVAQALVQANPSSPATLPQAAAGTDLWYVRPVGGGQYGPASTEVFKQWISEGRVAHDTWVWRTGWKEWQRGRPALEALRPIAPSPPINAAEVSQRSTPSQRTPEYNGIGPANHYLQKRRIRRQKARTITYVLGGIVLLLLIILVVVVAR